LVIRLQDARRAVPFTELQAYLLQQTALGDLAGSYTLRTFQRDVPRIAEQLGVTIRYDRQQRGYVVADTEMLPAGFQRLLEAFEMQEFLRLPAALAPFVQLEKRRPLGLEYLRPLLRAAQNRQWVRFNYRKFWEDAPSQRMVAPLLLKEFRGRWYLLGQDASRRALRCFGLDRMQKLEATPQHFEAPTDFNPEHYYQDCFGIIRPDNAVPERVVLALEPDQGQYVTSYPLHHSQRVLLATDDEVRVELTVFNTHDLLMELLSMGERIEVLEPLDLREQMHHIHTAALQGIH
jgi:predicted DNA-binding transcriptional regulator YafY